MEDIEVKTQKPLLVKIADQLLKDQQELDQLAVQLSLGKAEVKDKFEEAKKQLKKSVREFRKSLTDEQKQNLEWLKSVKAKLNDLDAELAKGKAETKPIFEEEKNSIGKKLDVLKEELRKNPSAVKLANYFATATEKMNLQLELFEKKLGTTKTELTQGFKDEMNIARDKINSIIAKTKEKKENLDEKMDQFNDEIRISYTHLKKAIEAL